MIYFLLIFLVSLAEVFLTIWLYRMFGASQTLILVLAVVLTGFLICIVYRKKSQKDGDSGYKSGPDNFEFHVEGASRMSFFVPLILFLFPGLITDIIGLVVLLPPIRKKIVHWLAEQMWENYQKIKDDPKLSN